jgi:antitoxin HicB
MLVAILIKSSGSQINRALDPSDGNVTIQALQRAAALVGRRVKVELF